MFGERNGRYKRTDLHEKDGCVVKKASHGIRLGSWERMSVVGLISWSLLDWMGSVVYMRMLYHVYMRGIDGLMNRWFSNWLVGWGYPYQVYDGCLCSCCVS